MAKIIQRKRGQNKFFMLFLDSAPKNFTILAQIHQKMSRFYKLVTDGQKQKVTQKSLKGGGGGGVKFGKFVQKMSSIIKIATLKLVYTK